MIRAPRRTPTDPRAFGGGRRDLGGTGGLGVLLLMAAGLGLAAGLAPVWTALVVCGAGGLAMLLWRVELAALAVIAGPVLADHLGRHRAGRPPSVTEALAVVLVASWGLRRLRGPLHDGPRSRVTDAVVAFLLVVLMATLVHPNGVVGLDVLLRHTAVVAVALVLIEVLRGPVHPRLAALTYVAAATSAAGFGLVACCWRGETRVAGPTGTPDDLAFLLLAAVPLALVLRGGRGAPASEGSAGRSPWLVDRLLEVAVVVLLVAMLGTFSRPALVGLATMLLVALVTRLLSVPAVLAVVAVLLIGSSVAAMAAPDLVRTGLEQQSAADQDRSGRLDLWRAAVTTTLDNPVLGLGPGALEPDPADDRAGRVDDVAPTPGAHDTWLETSAELGLPGLLALLVVIGGGFGAAWSRWRRDADPLAAGVCAALVGAVAAATLVTAQDDLPLWLLSALGTALSARPPARPRARAGWGRANSGIIRDFMWRE